MILIISNVGFIGANFVLDGLAQHDGSVINVDKPTYGGDLASLQDDARHVFVYGNIGDAAKVSRMLDEHSPHADGRPYEAEISYVTGRPCHNRRYAIATHKPKAKLSWNPAETFESGIRKTVQWYLTGWRICMTVLAANGWASSTAAVELKPFAMPTTLRVP